MENFEEPERNLNDKLDAVSQKNPKDGEENDSCANYLEESHIFPQYTMVPNRFSTNGYAKIRNDLSAVRDCLGNRMQVEEQAVKSLLEGKVPSLQFESVD